MNRFHNYYCLWLLLLALLASPAKATAPDRLIFDTDLSSDVDDAGAVAVVHSLADLGKVEILAMMISSGDPWSGPCLAALNTSFGRPDIPIGIIKGNAVTHVSKYTRYIAEKYPNDFSATLDPPEATSLYRKILAGQPDGSVTVVSVGYFSNLSRLLESSPDAYSPLGGRVLVAKKVKRLICMGGQFPSGREWNIYQDTPAAVLVASQWPTSVIFCGFEIGNAIMTGKALRNAADGHPLREAYRLYNNLANRQSWDQTTVLLAGPADGLRNNHLILSEQGKVRIDEKGNNAWEATKDGQHRYVISTAKTKGLAGIIDDLMLKAADVAP